MATTVDKVKEKRASQVKLKRTTGFDTEYVEADLKLAEMNFYLLDDVLILAKRYRDGVARALWKARLEASGPARAPPKQALRRIFKGVTVHPLKAHFLFKDLSKLPLEFPGLANKRMLLSVLESLGSFHFLGPGFSQSVL